MEKIFGTDGIRGVANAGFLKIEFLLKLVPAIVDKYHPKQVVIGQDTRISGDMLVHALAAIFNSYGVDITITGVVSTPALAYITANSDFDLGIMISASHNPYQDNGIKIFNKNGQKLSQKEEETLTDMISLSTAKLSTHADIGTTDYTPDLVAQYESFVESVFHDLDMSKYKVVVDCANGSLSAIAGRILDKFSGNIIYISDKPNGLNINDNCGVMYPNTFSAEVIKQEADFGIAFDGDGDRVLFCDEKGEIVDGDQLIGFIAKETKDIETVAITKISNLALDRFLKTMKINTIRTEVGDKYIAHEILQGKAQIGGEKSGHIIVNKGLNTGDGLISALTVIEAIGALDGPASQNLRPFILFPAVHKNIATQNKNMIDTPDFQKFLEPYTKDESIRVLVRKSGTENVIRILVEGQDTEKIQCILNEIENKINAG